MLKLNESVTAYDIAEVLQDESGIFEAISPTGEKYQLVARSGFSISNFRAAHDKKSQNKPWRLRKVGELRTEQETV